jgi:hypothetical protein
MLFAIDREQSPRPLRTSNLPEDYHWRRGYKI